MEITMASLIDFLRLYGIDVNRASYKIHLATGNEYPPLEAFYSGTFKEWQENQAQKNFQCDHVIGLIGLSPSKWLFAGVYQILDCELRDGRCFYSSSLLPGQSDVIGRIIVEHNRRSRASYLWGKESTESDYMVAELREKPMSVGDFPGYHATTVSYSLLKTIVTQSLPSWKGALSNLKGVYLIVDTSNGKQYVGSALGGDGLWQRWSEYVHTGHGGNKELRAVLTKKGSEHVSKFQYSILEIADSYASDYYVRERESYWKNALLSKQFGYNQN